ncbi:MAG: DNRLRE domain-containing protein [Tepidisphaeraceae bacterium]
MVVEPLEQRSLLAATIEVLSSSTGSTAVYTSSNGTAFVQGTAVHVRASTSTFEGTGSQDPLKSRISWNFGDETAGSDYNTLPGFNAAHVYDTTGTYTITLTIDDPSSGSPVTDTITVQINADTRSAIHVDSDLGSDISGNGSQGSPYKTLGKADDFLADNTRILFKRGATNTYDVTSEVNFANIDNVLIGNYGTTGAIPTLRWAKQSGGNYVGGAFFNLAPSSNRIQIQSIHFVSASTALDPKDGPYTRGNVADLEGKNILVRDTTFDNLNSYHEATSSTGDGVGILVQDNRQVDGSDDDSLQRYFLFFEGPTDVTVIGNKVNKSWYEIPVRFSKSTRALAYANDLTNLKLTGPSHKGALRMHQGAYQYAAENILTSGSANDFGPLNGGTGDPTGAAAWYVFDGNDVSGSLRLGHGLDGGVVRNNVFRAAPDGTTADVIFVLEDSTGRYASDHKVENVHILHNTSLINSNSAAFLETHEVDIDRVDSLTLLNNLNMGTGSTQDNINVRNNGSGGTGVFTRVDDNVWISDGGQSRFKVGNSGGYASINLSAWNSSGGGNWSPDGDDIARPAGLALDSDDKPTTADVDIAARSDYARFDRDGVLRPATNATAGAVQRSADTTPPAEPTGLTATPSASGILLDWNDNTESDLAGYQVWRAPDLAGPWTNLTPSLLTSSTYNDTAAPAGQASYYLVFAFDTIFNASTSADVSATRPGSTVDIPASHDAQVRDGANASTNYGSSTVMEVKVSGTAGNTREAYLTFSLAGIDSVASAKLKLNGYLTNGTDTVNVTAYEAATTPINEGTITWNNKPGSTGSALATTAVTSTAAHTYEWDLSTWLRDKKRSGASTVTVVLKSAGTTTAIANFSSEEASSGDPVLAVVEADVRIPSADAHVRDGTHANTNFGSNAVMEVKVSTTDFTRETYLKFDLANLGTVGSAKLRLFGYLTGATTPVSVAAYDVASTSWTEGGITWNTKPASTGSALATTSVTSTTGAWYEWDVTSWLQAKKSAGATTASLVLKGTAVADPLVNFTSGEGTSSLPELFITP